jgi:DNA-binding transcriptional ArsR family regulator
MGWWQVSTDALAGGRFVISPLAETTASLLALEHGTAAHPGERRWLDTHRAAYLRHAKEHPAIPAILRTAAGRRWIPLLITVPPAALGGPSFDDELRLIADLHPARVTSDLAEVGLVPAADDLPRQAVSLLDWVWTNTVLPYWPVRRRILEADIAARTTRLGRGGWMEALSEMRPGARWLGGGRLQINASDRPPREVPGAAQLFFVPVTLGSGGWVAWDEPHRYALIYPCSGALAGHSGRAAAAETLAALLGPARAAVLMLLATPMTTTQLVAITGQGLGSVGRHLRILRAAGLLERHRAGRSVLYRRSPAGDLLVRIQDEAGLLRPAAAILELGLEGFDLAGAGAKLLVGRTLADAGQGPADGLGAAAGDPGRDERVQGFQVFSAQPRHHWRHRLVVARAEQRLEAVHLHRHVRDGAAR